MNPEPKPPVLKVLIVEDNPRDLELVLQELKDAGFDPDWERTETEAGYLQKLNPKLDLILSDYALPGFSGPRALELLQQRGWDIPFILLSGTIGEDVAVESIRGGAADYLMKDRLARLGPAIRRALEQKQARREYRRSAAQLQDSELRYRLMFESNPQPMWVYDRETLQILAVNDAAVATYGYTREEFLAMTLRDIRPAVDLPQLEQHLAEDAAARDPSEVWNHRRKDGSLMRVRINAQRLRFGHRPARLVMISDETARLEAEDRVQVTEAQLQEVINHSPVVFYHAALDPEELVLEMVSENAGGLFGSAREALHAGWWREQIHPDDRAAARESLAATRRQGLNRSEYRLRHHDGTYRWIEDNRRLVRNPSGTPTGFVGVWTDVTERKRAEEVLRELTSRQDGTGRRRVRTELFLLFVITVLAACILSSTNALEAPLELFISDQGHLQDEVLGTFAVFLTGLVIFSYRRWREATSQVLQERRVQEALRTLHTNLEARVQERTTELAKTNRALHTEIAERKAAEEGLRSSEERFRQLAENITEVFWLADPVKRVVLYVSPAYATVWGRSPDSLLANPRQWLESVHEEDRPRVARQLSLQASGGYGETYRIVRPDGSIRWVHDRAFPVRNADGEVYRIAGVAEDITDQKQMEAQFYRAQRLESIGTLASGIAHDLNNILAPILMSAGLLKIRKPGENNDQVVATIEKSAQRGAQLVRQLLMFGRGDAREKVSLPVVPLIEEMVAIGRRTFPKSIEIRTDMAPDLRPVRGDSTQVHQILLNLCVNARDAMPAGGLLTLGARPADFDPPTAARHPGAKPGCYISLSVTDTGTGMTPEVMDKIFDPFFTTKELGKGTGLGLATVLGLVKSHAGFMTLRSEPGRGTTFEVFLPVATTEAAAAPHGESPAPHKAAGELILIVDDEAPIREAIESTLIRQGYTTLTASDGVEGWERYQAAAGKVRLVLTDWDMPRMDGMTLMKKLAAQEPGLKFLVSSGLTGSAAVRAREADLRGIGAKEILLKPYTGEQLLAAVRRALME